MTDTKQSPYLYRQLKLSQVILNSHFSSLALNPGPSLTYFTGLRFHLMERPVVAIFLPNKPPTIILPELESAKVTQIWDANQVFTYGEDPTTWKSVFQQAMDATGIPVKSKVGVEPRQLRFLELRLLESSLNLLEFSSAESLVASIRIQKDEYEIGNMRKAVEIAENALQATIPFIKSGISEKDIASELTLQLLRGGSEPEMPFTPIVSAGPNSANPHATPSNRKLQPGDCLVVDWGATYEGYISDITRTFAIEKIDPEMDEIARIVAQANLAGRKAAGPEVPAGQVDAAARQVIETAGYGQYFLHRTGHGIGMEGHEEPYIRSGNDQVLLPGMTFTVEPGVYLPNRNGVRIEDNIVITTKGAESLTSLPREVRILG
jgi:Xaa-Pro aminopeptidase